VYDLRFLHELEAKFALKTPSIVHFFKKHLCYEFHLEEDLRKETGDLFTGFTKRGFQAPEEVPVTDELLAM
jgi:hypothetical protein